MLVNMNQPLYTYWLW